ncbi:MAG: SNF2 helicase associated domain-containing protein [Pirellulales bacterium]|nr:SNF2 helicase associated domain-containing protein [Pirellulales bacterium]
MQVASQFSTQFAAATRSKGESYFRRGAVQILDADPLGFTANVKGSRSRPYQVDFDCSHGQGGVSASCTCPHYREGSFCKHIWATLLTLEREGWETGEFRIRGGLLHEFDDDDFEDDFDSALEFARSRGDSRTKSARRPAKAASSRSWDVQLASFPVPASLAPPQGDRALSKPRQALFVLDVGQSHAAGALVVHLYQQDRKKNGQWRKPRQLKAGRRPDPAFSPEDQRLLALALGNYAGTSYGYGSYSIPLHALLNDAASQIEIIPALHEVLLPELCATGRFGWVLSDASQANPPRPLAWEPGPAWQFRLVVDDQPKKKQWLVRGEFIRDEETRTIDDPVLLLSSGIVVWPDTLARLQEGCDWRWLTMLRKIGPVEVPYKDRESLVGNLWGYGAAATALLPPNLQVPCEELAPRPVLRIVEPDSDSRRNPRKDDSRLFADVAFQYGDNVLALDDPTSVLLGENAESVHLRDRRSEVQALTRLDDWGFGLAPKNYYPAPPAPFAFPRKHFSSLVQTLAGEGWHIEAQGVRIRQAGQFKLSVASGVDWFDVDARVDFDGVAATLPALLAAARNQDRFVQLDDGTYGLLPEEWLKRFAPLAELAQIEGDQLRFRASQALILDTLLEERAGEIELALDAQFRKVRDRLATFRGIAPAAAPRGFQGELRPYQQEGIGWLKFLADFGLGGCLADDMGLGKTIQLLAHLQARKTSPAANKDKLPALVVAPKTLVFNWLLEAKRFTPRLKTLAYVGKERRDATETLADVDLVVTTYGTLRRDIEELQRQPFDYVVLDEAQAIKNDSSITAKSVRLLRANHRLALTGTPVENHLGELWSLFEFLNPGMLGRAGAFKDLARRQADTADALEPLRRGLAPFILRRTKQQVLKDLPEKTEQTLYCDLLPADRKRYDELRDYYRGALLNRIEDKGLNQSKMQVLEALLRLRQTACHAGLVDKKLVAKPSAKLDALHEQLAEIADEGHKALVFSQFTSLLAIVRQRLDADGTPYEYLDGRTRNRQERVDRFQNDPACPLFLISLKAGGCGLNLTAADYVFLLDPWWNPAVEAQAIDRAHRIGQQRPVFAYRLIARDTVEEKILQLQEHKRELADAIVSGDKSLLSALTADDLRLLLS